MPYISVKSTDAHVTAIINKAKYFKGAHNFVMASSYGK